MKMLGANPSSRWRFSEARPSDHHRVGRARILGRRKCSKQWRTRPSDAKMGWTWRFSWRFSSMTWPISSVRASRNASRNASSNASISIISIISINNPTISNSSISIISTATIRSVSEVGPEQQHRLRECNFRRCCFGDSTEFLSRVSAEAFDQHINRSINLSTG